MTTKVKTHKRKNKNSVSVVKEHTRKDGKKSPKDAGCEYKSCSMSECSTTHLKEKAAGKYGSKWVGPAKKELKKRGL